MTDCWQRCRQGYRKSKVEGEAAWGRMGKPWPALSLEGRDGHGAPGAGRRHQTEALVRSTWTDSLWPPGTDPSFLPSLCPLPPGVPHQSALWEARRQGPGETAHEGQPPSCEQDGQGRAVLWKGEPSMLGHLCPAPAQLCDPQHPKMGVAIFASHNSWKILKVRNWVLMTTHSSVLAGKSHRQRSLAGYSPQGHKRVRHDLD